MIGTEEVFMLSNSDIFLLLYRVTALKETCMLQTNVFCFHLGIVDCVLQWEQMKMLTLW